MVRFIKNTIHLLNAFAANCYYRFPGRSISVIGITGTDGKTTTTHLMYEILKQAQKNVSMISSVYAKVGGKEFDTGFHVTTPNPWFLQKMLRKAVAQGDSYVVLEVTSHGLHQHRVWGIPFIIGIITNITPEHLDYHETYREYARSKILLLKRSGVSIVNAEDSSYDLIVKEHRGNIRTYGIRSGDVSLKNVSFKTPLPGTYNQYNVLAAYAAARELGIADKSIQSAIRHFKGITGRYDSLSTQFGFTVIIDFAHTSNGLEQVLSTVRALSKGKIIHVFGCAGLRDYKKRPIMGEISSRFSDVTIITEEDYRTEDFDYIVGQIKSGIKRKQNVFVYKFRQDAINYATSIAKKGDTIILTGKGHEKSLCRGRVEIPWDEYKAVQKALTIRAKMK